MLAAALGVLGAMALVMTAAWVFQRAVGNAGWVDVFWTFGSGLSCAAVALLPLDAQALSSWRQSMIAGLQLLWALRLGSYVALRVRLGPEDARYAALRTAWGARFQSRMFWLLIVQAPATALLSLSVWLAAHVPSATLRPADAVGIALILICIAGEGLADAQMRRFKAQRNQPGAVCEIGLWRWSRHPNYFFETLAWVAYPVIAVRFSDAASWAALIAPLVMYALVRFLTGVPALEASLLRSKGEAYRRYQQRVSVLIPLPRRRGR